MNGTGNTKPINAAEAHPAFNSGGRLFAGKLRVAALIVLLLLAGAMNPVGPKIATLFLYRQDLPVIAGLLGLFAVLAVWRGGTDAVPFMPAMPRTVAGRAAILAAAVAVVGFAGHYLLLHGYALSRDEQMTLFDMHVYRSGHFAARLPDEWRPYFAALNTMYMPESLAGKGWVSSYRPGNAVFHAFISAVTGTSALANPLLNVVGLVATWRVAARVLPGDTQSQTVALLLFATSSQILTMGMTSYAMPGRLALNMIWLALLFHDRWYSHVGVLAVGFIATGWQQLVYHAFFAAPVLFIFLVMRRRWALSLVYALTYAAMILFWSKFTGFGLRELGVTGKPNDVDGFLWVRLLWAIGGLGPEYLWTMAINLLRAIAWNNAIVLPLLVAGIPVALRSRDPRVLAMTAAFVALIAMKLVLRPEQGHGWGYRYLHGALGIVCILAAIGWRDLRARGAIGPRHLAVATAATLLVFLPFQWSKAYHFTAPYAQADRAIATSGAAIVVVDDQLTGLTNDLVINAPYLDRAPVRLLASKLRPDDMVELCRRGPIGFADAHLLAPIAQEFSETTPREREKVPRLRAAAQAVGCTILPLRMSG